MTGAAEVPQLGTQKEFATLIGRSEAMVNKHKRAGRLVMVGRLVDFEASRARIRNASGVPSSDNQCPVVEHALRVALRDAVSLQALFCAAEGRSSGDHAEKLLAEAIAIMAANLFDAVCGSPAGTFPDAALRALGQVHALARAREQVLENALRADADRLSFLLDQVGWLDSLVEAPLRALVQSLQLAAGGLAEVAR